MNFLTKLVKKIKNKKELKKSNYARDYGWYIEYEGELIGELIDCKWSDMFWDNYTIISKDKRWNTILVDKMIWDSNKFKFKNKYFLEYATGAYYGHADNITLNDTIGMRALYLTN